MGGIEDIHGLPAPSLYDTWSYFGYSAISSASSNMHEISRPRYALRLYLCEHCGAKYKKFKTKCKHCGALLTGKSEVLHD